MFDPIGILVLAALAVLFGFLLLRARRAKNAFVKWGGMAIAGLLALASAAVLVLALAGYSRLNRRHDNPVADLQIAGTPQQIARGEQLAHICADCHSANNQLPLTGVNFEKKFGLPPLAVFYAPNLTPGGNIDDWTDGEVLRAIREGVHKSGRSLLIMPPFSSMSDDDAQAVIAYLRSQPVAGEPAPANRFSLFGAVFTNLVDFRTARAPVGAVTAPPPGTREYGKYMVEVIQCRDCHGEQLQGKPESNEPGPPPGPNLTAIVPQWTEEQFMTFFNTGVTPWGPTPIVSMPDGSTGPRMPWPVVRAAATDAELKAMYDYLHSLPPVEGPLPVGEVVK
jgi:mono/diheme cytochrome c family protein